MNQPVAIIDLGTNTFHLLIAVKTDGHYKIIHQQKIGVKMGLGGINLGVILPDALDRAITTLTDFRNTIRDHKIDKVYAFGTSALRNAGNAPEVVEAIRLKTGIEVSIISGEEEARFIYEGVKSAMDLGDEPLLIMDIGGGSVEFIIGNNKKIYWKQSFEIGGQRLLEKFKPHDPITQTHIAALDNYFEIFLHVLFDAIEKYNPTTLVGSSGTFDTLSDIYCAKNNITKNEHDSETPLTIEGFHHIYHELITKNRAERLQIPGMIELRVDMIVVGCCLIRFIIEKPTFRNIRVSNYSLKEGVLAGLTNQ